MKQDYQVDSEEENEFDSSEWQGRSEQQVKNNALFNGLGWIGFIILVIWYAAYELIRFFS